MGRWRTGYRARDVAEVEPWQECLVLCSTALTRFLSFNIALARLLLLTFVHLADSASACVLISSIQISLLIWRADTNRNAPFEDECGCNP